MRSHARCGVCLKHSGLVNNRFALRAIAPEPHLSVSLAAARSIRGAFGRAASSRVVLTLLHRAT